VRPNYNKKESPFLKGELKDIIKPKRPRFQRVTQHSDKETVIELQVDLVQVLASVGITIQNVYTICKKLSDKGWIKIKRIKRIES